eukprot:TRINITY_DN6821_c1_g1_i1.p1 TRINITY_DN6821_c1_g1~~TRINITY_DN6821_c1_g1_i1.p1  ORF type:complete len:200 (-),score=29.06 TRINITY_DN6821_c1_g1_i1:301-828(-)
MASVARLCSRAFSFKPERLATGAVKVIHAEMGRLEATRDVPRGTRVMFEATTVAPSPTRFTIQATPELHVAVSSDIKYTNHSCEPNCEMETFVDGQDGAAYLTTVRDVNAGEELSFNYLTNEWDMDEGFQCQCGTPSCMGYVRGFKHLEHAVQMRMIEAGKVRPHIEQLVKASSE